MITISIRRMLALRVKHGDRLTMDYLTIALLLGGAPGLCETKQLQKIWGITQPNVSRRMKQLATAELIEMTAGHGAYAVHELKLQ